MAAASMPVFLSVPISCMQPCTPNGLLLWVRSGEGRKVLHTIISTDHKMP